MPPKRLVRAVLLLAGAIVLAAVAFSIDIQGGVTAAETGDASLDVSRLVRAYERDGGNDAATSVFVSIQHATKRGPKRGAQLLLDELPSRTANADASIARAQQRIRTVKVSTEAGRACKRAVLGLAARQRALFVGLGAGVDSDVDTWTAVDRYAVGTKALRRWWTGQAARCSSLAPEPHRAAVQAQLRGL